MNLLFDRPRAHVPLFLPNLTLWYRWHSSRSTLPAAWQGRSLDEISRDLQVPVWDTARGYRVDHGGIDIERQETATERVITYRASTGQLTERWQLGPDGDWWQTAYPVQTPDDLEILLEIVSARRYIPEMGRALARAAKIGAAGVVGLELPRRPFSQLCLEWLGWGDGLMLLFDSPDLVTTILETIEEKVQALAQSLAATDGVVFVSPDNLDSQFVSPGFFRQYLAPSYARTAAILHAHGRKLLVDTGGPIRSLLPLLAACQIDGVQGVSGPPQCDAALPEARTLAGPDLVLWGGIPQDALLDDFPAADFVAEVQAAAAAARHDPRMVLGIADRVPVDANLARLAAIPELIAAAIA